MSRSRQNADTPNKIEGVPVGATTPSTGAFTSLSASGAANLGGTTTLSGATILSGSVSGAAMSAYFGSPPALGGTTPAAGTFTTLTSSSITVNSPVAYSSQPAPTSKAAAATLTVAEILVGIVQYTGSAATLTLPLGTAFDTGLLAGLANDMAFEFSIVNTGAGTVTVAGNTGVTIVGLTTVANGGQGRFRVRKTATSTYIAYRIA